MATCTRSSCNYRHHPMCRGYKSGNRCIYGHRCLMLMVRRNPARGREKKVLKEQLLFQGEKKRSKVVYVKTQIQWILFYGKLKNWDWTLRRDTPWNSQDVLGTKLKFGKEIDNLEASSKKVNHMSEILARRNLRNEHLEKLHDKKTVSAKQRGIWWEKI